MNMKEKEDGVELSFKIRDLHKMTNLSRQNRTLCVCVCVNAKQTGQSVMIILNSHDQNLFLN